MIKNDLSKYIHKKKAIKFDETVVCFFIKVYTH